jgi:2-iminobutanoate/2-iminopropanoate deaminase
VFLKNFADFERMNKTYEAFFAGHKPARTTVEVSRLPKDALVEIECVVFMK